MTSANGILNNKASSDLNTFLCVKTHPFHDGIKHVVVNRKYELKGLKINRYRQRS